MVSVKLNISLAHGNFAVACSEIEQAVGKLMFDGSNEHVNCVAQHEDYGHLIHKAGLLLVGPLLKDKNGRGYRCPRQGQPECKHIITRAEGTESRNAVRFFLGFLGSSF